MISERSRTGGARAVAVVLAVMLGRFALIVVGIEVLPLLGLRGWDVGLVVNGLCVVYAVVVVSAARMWSEIGLTLWRSWPALLWLVPFALEAASWTWPQGPRDAEPGAGWWALTFVLVAVNEELLSRGFTLARLSRSFSTAIAVVSTGVLFGLQHLSALATSDADVGTVLTNVDLTAAFGFAFAAYQARFRWLTPLIVLHALSDLAGELTPGSPGDVVVLATTLLMVATGVVLLRHASRGGPGGAASARTAPTRSAAPEG
ncbi:Abortive infection protein [Beutenbergia cavernae DSM 12333]|uniref:Abortive infection protein n=1 Tax=Beutenbergia cavernae (strain ATCC BAA-8 / DSM 12333 / CCUG 43141 / JCM 11478 / NBRC 16432 / NCIMB 13614 / HKI 0122) TaxID=471853 RepID=C5C6G6_BEUC1|nr:CPBP family intramembrane glutamic endopeptidase [Beutenbergia cavernae]ACQ80372.1 Abortive infection protein [Beutenbergia cavernae DSM 12333]